MTIYFYDNIIHAAYMQQTFGFKFRHEPVGEEKDVLALIAAGCFTGLLNLSYLHPDCHEALKPQEDDYVRRKTLVKRVTFSEYIGEQEVGPGKARLFIALGGRIMEREGKPFIMPQQQD